MANLAALRAAVFTLSAKKPEGGGRITAPGRARIKLPLGVVEWKKNAWTKNVQAKKNTGQKYC